MKTIFNSMEGKLKAVFSLSKFFILIIIKSSYLKILFIVKFIH